MKIINTISFNYSYIRELRRSLGLTQKELAKQANVSLSIVQKIETGKIQPSVMTAARIAFALNKKIDDFIIKEVGRNE